MSDLSPQYDPKCVEKAVYQKWLNAKAFHAVPETGPRETWTKAPFSIVIPPPNVTGALHLGHAINGTIQDVLTRYHRMKGDNTLWMPGIDHAGIATQAVVEKTIFEKEKKNRHDLGREELVRRIWEWKEQFGTRILSQLQSIGASCDWDRTRFTLDETCAKAVREAFFKMFKDGLIFRGKRLVNWDTHLQTAVADDEIYHETVKGQMTSIKYPVADDAPLATPNAERQTPNDPSDVERPASDAKFLVVATTRPETMLGDTALAVHPDDPRYKHLIGGHVIVPLVGRRIPIIADGLLVDPKFGTGVVKVTPAHDPNDYATGVRHNLEQINLLTPDGKVNENGAGEFLGKKYSYTGLKFATAARKAVLADLETLGLIADTKVHEHEVGHSDRSKTPIEPFLSDQWFVRMGDVGSDNAVSETRPSGSDAVQPPPHSNALAYFITFHTYATWLHGEEQGSVDPEHNAYEGPFIPPDMELLSRDAKNLKHPPVEFSLAQRQSVLRTIREVASHREWTLHAVNVRATHVHLVVSGNHAPERMMNDFKAYATRRLIEASLLENEVKPWGRHGSTRYLWKPEHLIGAVHYTLHQQGDNALGTTAEKTLPDGRVSDVSTDAGITLANGQKASGLAQAAMDAVTSGRVKITPERYAKGYLDWLGKKRDWCISRQLWWGHRIPVWTRKIAEGETSERFRNDLSTDSGGIGGAPTSGHKAIWNQFHRDPATGEAFMYSCVAPDNSEYERRLEADGFVQDPDVLDTWFSSALWPISTMGWPNAVKTSETRPSGSVSLQSSSPSQTLPHGRVSDGMLPEPELLPYFYPTSVLSTARDILTLWVARMVMFGLYCDGDVPFKDVYVHPVIQDGEGKIMSKSKGNGVDPVDIVASHGADALRFTLASLATETQDIRMPVTKDPATGTNTSPKFDIGRNFANKIWNASRFILSNVEEKALRQKGTEAQKENPSPSLSALVPQSLSAFPLEDRWILSRLHATIRTAEAAINGYRFAELAEALRTFFWTDLCDWYLEIAKARIKSGDETVQTILFECLETSLKLLHPLMPFITEEIWSKLPNRTSLLVFAPWPQFGAKHLDLAAEAQLALIQSVTSAIREIQNRYPAAKGKHAIFQPRDAAIQSVLEQSRQIIESLAGIHIAENSPSAQKPENAANALLSEVQIFIAGVIDKTVETARLTKRQAELEKIAQSTRTKLANESFTSKAPPHIIQGLRDQLAKYEEELAAIAQNLAELQ